MKQPANSDVRLENYAVGGKRWRKGSSLNFLIGLIFLSSAIFGALLFSAAVVARIAVSNLDESSAADFLRPFWTTYHRTALFCTAILSIAMIIGGNFLTPTSPDLTIATTLSVAMSFCFFVGLRLIPKINEARDVGDSATFDLLHRIDIFLVSSGLFINLVVVSALFRNLGKFVALPH